MIENLIVKYLEKENNFKKIYKLLIKNSIPSSIKNEKYETEDGNVTNVGFPVYDDIEKNMEVWVREINVYNKQSLQNYIECIQELYIFLKKHELRWKEYKVLDIGARSGVGTNLLGMLFCDTVWGFGTKFVIDALDIDSSWEKYMKLLPYVNSFICKDVFDVENGLYDICICSHTIEHLDNPVEFVKKITDIANEFAVFYCPYDEKNISPRSGHRVINDKIIKKMNPVYIKYIKSINRKSEDLYFVFFITSKKYKSEDK